MVLSGIRASKREPARQANRAIGWDRQEVRFGGGTRGDGTGPLTLPKQHPPLDRSVDADSINPRNDGPVCPLLYLALLHKDEQTGAEPDTRQILFFRFPKLIRGGKTGSVFWICRVPRSLFLAWKISHRHAFPLNGRPSMRRPMRPRLYRHHLIGFIWVVVSHFPFAVGPPAAEFLAPRLASDYF